MNWIRQFVVVTLMVLRTIPQRLGWSLAATLGIAFVVMVMVAVFSIAEGFRATMENTGTRDTALVLRSGSDSEMASTLQLDATRIIADAPGVLRDASGAVASAEMYAIVDLPMRGTGTEANVPLRGVQPSAFAVRRELKITAGRRFEEGRNEIIAGEGAAREFAGLDVGSRLRWGDTEWTVVGHFTAGDSLSESELWADVRVLQPAYRRGSTFQSVVAKLESEDSFTEFKDALTADPRVRVRVLREDEYYASQSEVLYGLITGLGSIVTLLMAVGAVFGAINTMYSAVAARTREIATLRALGFRAGPVVISVLVESMLLALAGGLIGGIVSYAAFNGYTTTTLNFQSFSQVAFAFRVTPGLMVQATVVSMLMGLFGGFFPAIRAARLPISIALREL